MLDAFHCRDIQLHGPNCAFKVWRNDQCVQIALRNNIEVQLAELFTKKWLFLLHHEVVAVGVAAQGISHYISLARDI